MNLLKLVIAVFICQIAGIIGSFFTAPSIPTWYAMINKPEFTPPNWLFAPVWIALFLLMGISVYLIWEKSFQGVKIALAVFAIQLFLNILWSILFFSLHLVLIAFIEILLLWFAIIFTIILFYKISRTASYLLIPYLLWVSFAAVLNFYLWTLN